MRILVVNKKDDRMFISSLVEQLLFHGISVSRDHIFIFFEVSDIKQFWDAIWAVYSEFSKDSRGSVIEYRRFFRINDYPITFWYQLERENGSIIGIRYGRL